MPDRVLNKCKLFADDTKLIGIIKSLHDLAVFQEDILVSWSFDAGMSFNEEKCKVMFFERFKEDSLNLGFLRDATDMTN